jgi:hypothetical protein
VVVIRGIGSIDLSGSVPSEEGGEGLVDKYRVRFASLGSSCLLKKLFINGGTNPDPSHATNIP